MCLTLGQHSTAVDTPVRAMVESLNAFGSLLTTRFVPATYRQIDIGLGTFDHRTAGRNGSSAFNNLCFFQLLDFACITLHFFFLNVAPLLYRCFGKTSVDRHLPIMYVVLALVRTLYALDRLLRKMYKTNGMEFDA